jgi:hypothetical protein
MGSSEAIPPKGEVFQPFCNHIMEYFSYLADEYHFQIVKMEENPASGEVVYKNPETGVLLKVHFETDGGSCSMGIGRISQDGKPEKLFSAIDPNGNQIEWEFLNVNDALTCDSPEDQLPATLYDGTKTGLYLGENAMWDYMEDHARTLHRHGSCILQGDLKLLPEAKKSLIKNLKEKGWKVPGFFHALKTLFSRPRS